MRKTGREKEREIERDRGFYGLFGEWNFCELWDLEFQLLGLMTDEMSAWLLALLSFSFRLAWTLEYEYFALCLSLCVVWRPLPQI